MPQEINVLLALMIIVSFLVAIVLHEWAHVQMASWLGDRSLRSEGRQTLRLRSHLDPVGMVMCLILAFQPLPGALPPLGLGWGKPVKPEAWKMRVKPDLGVLLVACAGPICNLIVAVLAGLLLRYLDPILGVTLFARLLEQFVLVFAVTNISLILFNMIPLFPLDGYTILYTLLPRRQAGKFARSALYGPFIILALFFFLPFVARLSGIGDFPLFRLPYYIWQGAMALISLITGLPLFDHLVPLYLF